MLPLSTIDTCPSKGRVAPCGDARRSDNQQQWVDQCWCSTRDERRPLALHVRFVLVPEVRAHHAGLHCQSSRPSCLRRNGYKTAESPTLA